MAEHPPTSNLAMASDAASGAELQALDRVLNRLSAATDSKFAQVVPKVG